MNEAWERDIRLLFDVANALRGYPESVGRRDYEGAMATELEEMAARVRAVVERVNILERQLRGLVRT